MKYLRMQKESVRTPAGVVSRNRSCAQSSGWGQTAKGRQEQKSKAVTPDHLPSPSRATEEGAAVSAGLQRHYLQT